MAWIPEQNFGNGVNNIHIHCRKNIRPIDNALKERLKSVSLVITTLLTSLHDTTTENLNKGFKVATYNLDKIAKATERVLEKVEQILEITDNSPQVIVVMAVAMIMLTASSLTY